MSAFDDLAKQAWQASKAGRELDARLLLGAAITALAPANVRPIVVGGTAVDFWAADTTSGSLQPSKLIRASQDIDIVVTGYAGDGERLREALHASNAFRRSTEGIPVHLCRSWVGKQWPILVEIIDDDLAGDPDRVVTIDIDSGHLSLWGKEDTLWQYAENAISQRSRDDWTRALAIRGAQDLDWDYVTDLANQDGMQFLVPALWEKVAYDDIQG